MLQTLADIILLTDFRQLHDYPCNLLLADTAHRSTDIRSRNIIHEEACGNLVSMPREAGLVRISVQLDEEAAKNSSSNDPTTTLSLAKEILEHYALDTKFVYWSATYRIQQLLASSYSALDDRVFIMGGAAHTHSPKAGIVFEHKHSERF